jgi:hypothetical protein
VLREDIESFGGDRGLRALHVGQDRSPARGSRVTCRRFPRCHPNPLFSGQCDCRRGAG